MGKEIVFPIPSGCEWLLEVIGDGIEVKFSDSDIEEFLFGKGAKHEDTD